MPNTSKQPRDDYLQSPWAFPRSLCVVSDQNHLQNCGQARRQSNKDEVAMTEKAAFPAAGTLLTQFPSAHLLF